MSETCSPDGEFFELFSEKGESDNKPKDKTNNVDMYSDTGSSDCDDDAYQVIDRKKRSLSVSPSKSAMKSAYDLKRLRTNKQNDRTVKITSIDPSIKLANTNPVKLGQALNAKTAPRTVKSVTKCRDGNILVTAIDDFQLQKLESMTKLGTFDVKVTKTVIPVKGLEGVITNVPLDTAEEDIMWELQNYDILGVHRITRKNDGVDKPTLAVKLTFQSTETLPEHVRLGYCRYTVKPYIPPVLQCYKCRKFGHYASECRGKQRCARCGEDHLTTNCSIDRQKFVCVNCGKCHSAAYGGCSVYREAQEVVSIAARKNIPFSEAKKIVSDKKSFASVVTGKEQSVSTKEVPLDSTTGIQRDQSTPSPAKSQPDHSNNKKPQITTHSVDTQTDFCDTHVQTVSTEQMVICFIKCISLMNSSSQSNFQSDVLNVVKTMLGLDLSQSPALTALKEPVVNIESEKEMTNDESLVAPRSPSIPTGESDIIKDTQGMSTGDHTYSTVSTRSADRSRSRSQHRSGIPISSSCSPSSRKKKHNKNVKKNK